MEEKLNFEQRLKIGIASLSDHQKAKGDSFIFDPEQYDSLSKEDLLLILEYLKKDKALVFESVFSDYPRSSNTFDIVNRALGNKKFDGYKVEILPEFQKLTDSKDEEISVHYTYSKDDSYLKINDKRIGFKRYSNSEAILDTLINSEDEFYSPGDYLDFKSINQFIKTEEIFSQIDDKAFYNTLPNINERVLKETGIKSFLILKDKMIQINPLYKRKEG